jgi:hypothetical protein
MSSVSSARIGIHGHVVSQLKTWKRLFGREKQTILTIPSLMIKY